MKKKETEHKKILPRNEFTTVVDRRKKQITSLLLLYNAITCTFNRINNVL